MPHLRRKIGFRCKLPEGIIFRNQRRHSVVGTCWLQATATCRPLHFPPHPLELQLQMAQAKLQRQKYLLRAFLQTTTKSALLDLLLQEDSFSQMFSNSWLQLLLSAFRPGTVVPFQQQSQYFPAWSKEKKIPLLLQLSPFSAFWSGRQVYVAKTSTCFNAAWEGEKREHC